MKFPRRTRRRAESAKPESNRPSTAPRMSELRDDSPAEFIDLSTNAFRDNFPKIAQRIEERRAGHVRRRTAEQAAVRPPSASGEEANDP